MSVCRVVSFEEITFCVSPSVVIRHWVNKMRERLGCGESCWTRISVLGISEPIGIQIMVGRL